MAPRCWRSIVPAVLLQLALGLGGVGVGEARASEPPADGAAEAAAEEPAAAEVDTEDPLEEAKALYSEGTGRYATADYEGAIELWTKAYTLVPATAEYREIKADLMWDIATAREKSFDVDGELSHLNQAKILLTNYLGDLSTIIEDEAALDKERARVEERLASIQAKIDAAKGPGEGPGPEPGPTEPLPSGKPFMITGGVLAGLGLVGLGVSGAGMAMGASANDISDLDPDDIDGRREQFDRGRTGNTLAIAGGVAGGVFLVTGVALLAVGAKREKARRGVAVTPTFGRELVGVGVSGRF